MEAPPPSRPAACKPPSGKRMKARAPPPPNQPPASCTVNNECKLSTDVGMLSDQGGINMKENMINRTVDFTVVLPDGDEQKNTVHGSKAVMDLLVDLCSHYHLNPAHHTLELQSWGTQQPLQYKPNTLIGALDVQKILLKEKTPEGKTRRPPPKTPEKTTRLVVNYLKTQKAVIRVNPEVPLESIIPAICEKCEVNQEHLILLRDTITGEELELTKSLNELGIKELYAWNGKRVLPSKAQSEPSLNCRETRNSTSCDTVEKEKKKFLGFFRTNKRSSKAEESSVRMDLDYASDKPLKLTTASQQSLDRIATAPNSPSVNTCSMTLGPSLSLGNISGMTANSEIKKRRAPLPPTVMPQSEETNGQEQTLSQIPQSLSQNELQKKKRRAPPPPTPPLPTLPNRIDEMEDKRQSTVGDGRHVPQKPPRGITRGPPQLVIPPPPPYPPPDSDMDLPVLYNGTDGTDTTKLVPKRDKDISNGHNCSTDDINLELSETEETTSVSSCFASEDTTEDSGVLSSPSDIASLDSQNDSMRSRDKSVNAQENLAGIESTAVAESCSLKNASFNSDESGNFNQSPEEDEAMEVRFENAETFIAAHLEQTLAAFDKELAAMEDMHENSERESVPSEMDSSFLQNVKAVEDITAAVPVTIIDEVPEADIAMQYTREGGDTLLSQTQADEDVPVNLISPGKRSNENNTGSFSKGDVNSGSHYLAKDLLQQMSPDPDFRHRNEEEQKYESRASTWEKRKKEEAALQVVSENATNFKLMDKMNDAKEKAKSLNEQNAKERIPSKMKTELEFRPASMRSTDDKEAVPPPSPWCNRVHSVVASYEPKIGLTTFKVVPPKPEVKHCDADVSLSTGAIKIDELGNLVAPNTGGVKKVAVNMPLSEAGETLIGRAKAYWRSNSIEKSLEESLESHSNKSPVTPISKHVSKASETKHDCLTGRKVAAMPFVGSKAVENNLGAEKTKPPIPVTQYPMKSPAAPVGNKDKVELPFQKPQRRTSSHYVASAIAKSLHSPQLTTSHERHSKEEENSAQRGSKAETESLPKRYIIMAKSCPMEPQPARTNESYPVIFSCDRSAANKLQNGAQSQMKNDTANVMSLNQASPTSCYKRSFSAPFPTRSSQDKLMEKETSCNTTQYVIPGETSFLACQGREQACQTNSLSSFRPYNAPSSSTACNSLVKSNSGHTIHNGSLKFNGAPLGNHLASEKEEKLSCTSGRNELEPNIREDNIYSVFGPKKRFKPVIQKPLPRDTSLHSALMEAIQTAGGREKLRKISDSAVNGIQKKTWISEPENERSALLAAIRGHSGASKLRKTSSSASEELQSFRNAELGLQIRETSLTERQCNPPLLSLPPPPPPPPPANLSTRMPRPLANSITENPGNARQALMEAIRLGTGAARLRKVPLLV